MDEHLVTTVANRYNQIIGGSPELDVNKRIFALTGNQFNLSDLFRKVFGYRGIPYATVKTNLNHIGKDSDALVKWSDNNTKSQHSSYLGSPIIHPLTIGNYKLPNEPLIVVTGSNNIVRTMIAGNKMRGTVKELIGENDYVIKVKGFAVNMDSDDLPDEDIRQLRRLKESLTNLPVNSLFLSLFNINNVVVTDVRFDAVEGHSAIQQYEIDLLSDDDYDLEVV